MPAGRRAGTHCELCSVAYDERTKIGGSPLTSLTCGKRFTTDRNASARELKFWLEEPGP